MPGQLLHTRDVLGAPLWIGGMALTPLALRPALAELDAPARLALHEGALRRFILIVWNAVPVIC